MAELKTSPTHKQKQWARVAEHATENINQCYLLEPNEYKSQAFYPIVLYSVSAHILLTMEAVR